MSATVIVNGQTVVHKDSGGVLTTSPDVCLTPIGNSVVAIAYTNIAKSSDTSQGSTSVSMDNNPIMLKGSVFSRSTGDEPGRCGGVSSGVNTGKAKFVNYSSDVFVDGRPTCRRLDPMVSNLSASGNTPPAPLQQGNMVAKEKDAEGHILSASLEFEHPNTISSRVTQPLLHGEYTVSGPETHNNDKDEHYVGFQLMVGVAGSYCLKIKGLDRERKPLEPEKV